MTQVDAMDPTSALRFGDARDWFFAKRYGLFLHWGLYALPAWHEQLQWRGRVDRREYEKLAAEWSPHRFDPDLWLDLAQEAGMGYVCLTTKHHDGFCLWATRQTDFCVTNTPDGRDILRFTGPEVVGGAVVPTAVSHRRFAGRRPLRAAGFVPRGSQARYHCHRSETLVSAWPGCCDRTGTSPI